LQSRPSYDDKLLRILRSSAVIFAEKGYHSASIRDISAATGISLSGLYYYFRSKEELLFLIQDHCFGTLLERLAEALPAVSDPEGRLRLFIRSHLRFFLANQPEMKVLSHEADVLTGDFRTRVSARKRAYADQAQRLLADLLPEDGVEIRTATFSLFGMLNWIYTWYRPERDGSADELADTMTHIFLNGVLVPRDAAVRTTEADPEGSPSIWRTG
jgi:TetR/AcrR family transcriptional regulator, cholesterol catabolism regulator